MKQKILITTAIDYVNDVIHIGHAYQKILADALARYYRQFPENEVFFLTGTDEHGSKTEEAAEKENLDPREFTDRISKADQDQLDSLNISYDRFIRTTDKDHRRVVEDFYNRVYTNGNDDIYAGEYSGIYCVGCEEFKKEKDLVDGRCASHSRQEVKTVTEKNYFFAWSQYEDFLKEWIKGNADCVQHEARRNEMLAFLDQGLEDIPISRPTVKFGIPVPNDPAHVLYVWFDALINYVTGAPEYWQDPNAKIIHLLGKDNVRWHTLLWPAMLKAAGYRLPSIVYGHDFFTLNGRKISKSLGNIIRPTQLVEKFGADAVRYYFLRYGPIRSDVDVTIDGLVEVYNSDLANGLGNLVSRVAKMAEKLGEEFTVLKTPSQVRDIEVFNTYMEKFRVDSALDHIWNRVQDLDRYIDHNRVWEQSDEQKEKSLQFLVTEIYEISLLLIPFLPETAGKIQEQLSQKKIKSRSPLFPRLTT